MEKSIGLLTSLLIFICVCFSHADTISVPLPQFSDTDAPITKAFDLETTFSDIQSVKLKVTGTASPGLACGDGVERPVFPYFELPASVLEYMNYPGSGFFMASSDEVSGSFSVEITFKKYFQADWDILLDGIHQLTLEINHVTGIGINVISQPSMHFDEVIMTVEGTIESSVHIIDDDKVIYIEELTEIAANWMRDEGGYPFSEGDLNYDGVVNMVDFGMLAEIWLEPAAE